MRRAAQISAIAPPPAKMLDFGGGFGFIAERFRDMGYQVDVLEESPNALDRLRQHGLSTLRELGEIKKNSYDVITAWHVIEHYPEPRALLRALHNGLKETGTLVIAVPNAGGLFAKLSFKHWIWTMPWHLHYFQPLSLRTVLRRSGFQIVREFTDVGDVAALEVMLGGMLRGSTGRLSTHGNAATTLLPPSLLRFALTGLLRPFSRIMQRFAKSVGMGEEIVIETRKSAQ